MPPGCGDAMLPDYCDFPESVLKILPEQAPQIPAGAVPRADIRCLPDSSTGTEQTEIQFVILIAHQFFVKAPDPLQGRLPPAPVSHGIHGTFVVHVMKLGTPGGKRTMVSSGDGTGNQALGFGAGGAADVISAGCLERGDAAVNVIGRELRMSIHAQDDLPEGRAD